MTIRKKSGLEKIKFDTMIMGYIILVGTLVGAGFLLFGMFQYGTWQSMKDENYLTNPDTPISQMKNATFTWSRAEINTKEMYAIQIALFGGGLLIASYFMLFAIPMKKDFHLIGCNYGKPICENTTNPNLKYCPECGLKLKLLKEKPEK